MPGRGYDAGVCASAAYAAASTAKDGGETECDALVLKRSERLPSYQFWKSRFNLPDFDDRFPQPQRSRLIRQQQQHEQQRVGGVNNNSTTVSADATSRDGLRPQQPQQQQRLRIMQLHYWSTHLPSRNVRKYPWRGDNSSELYAGVIDNDYGDDVDGGVLLRNSVIDFGQLLGQDARMLATERGRRYRLQQQQRRRSPRRL